MFGWLLSQRESETHFHTSRHVIQSPGRIITFHETSTALICTGLQGFQIPGLIKMVTRKAAIKMTFIVMSFLNYSIVLDELLSNMFKA